jgi:hypothetical protein
LLSPAVSAHFFYLLGELFGMERALINLIQNPQITEEMIGRIFRF